jgi:hypothetical protein
MKQSWLQSHAETLTQNMAGLFLAFCVLTFCGVSHSTSFKIQASLFVISYIRSYLIRRVFNNLKSEQ